MNNEQKKQHEINQQRFSKESVTVKERRVFEIGRSVIDWVWSRLHGDIFSIQSNSIFGFKTEINTIFSVFDFDF